LLAISEEPTLFPIACRNKPTKNCLSGGAWGGALGSKAASPTSSPPLCKKPGRQIPSGFRY
jgi:hypothetical protein